VILKDKIAVIYGAGGSLGSAVAKALADAGATVCLTGHREASLQPVYDDITHTGKAETAVVDAYDEDQVKNHLEDIVKRFGSVDISFNAVADNAIQNVPLIDMSIAQFVDPVTAILKTRFITAKAAAHHMIKQKSGVILSLTATPGGIGYPLTGGFGVACNTVEAFSRNLASEIGEYGVRVVNIRSGGSPDSRVFKEAAEKYPEIVKGAFEKLKADTMLKKMPLMQDIANLAVYLSSPLAAAITGVTVDATCGTTAALNYTTGVLRR
jgi:NAD(P)-dependent dehydrogenase (short-subunit alcohol dehydrogenase family)